LPSLPEGRAGALSWPAVACQLLGPLFTPTVRRAILNDPHLRSILFAYAFRFLLSPPISGGRNLFFHNTVSQALMPDIWSQRAIEAGADRLIRAPRGLAINHGHFRRRVGLRRNPGQFTKQNRSAGIRYRARQRSRRDDHARSPKAEGVAV